MYATVTSIYASRDLEHHICGIHGGNRKSIPGTIISPPMWAFRGPSQRKLCSFWIELSYHLAGPFVELAPILAV